MGICQHPAVDGHSNEFPQLVLSDFVVLESMFEKKRQRRAARSATEIMWFDSPPVESGKDIVSMVWGPELLIRDGENRDSESLQGVPMCATYGYWLNAIIKACNCTSFILCFSSAGWSSKVHMWLDTLLEVRLLWISWHWLQLAIKRDEYLLRLWQSLQKESGKEMNVYKPL